MNFDWDMIAGWIGMTLIILAYFLLSQKKLKSNSVTYNLLNLFGAAGILANTFVLKSWPSVVLNVIWITIAIYSILNKIKTKPVYKELK